MNNVPSPFADVSALKLALMAKQVRAQAARALQADPIAIVGMACRLPGGADTPDRFWQLLRDGVCVVREVPSDRWNGDEWYDPDLSTAGKTATKSGCFLDRIDAFDADYFGTPPREAERMDPQQRLFLEVAIEALDDAGLSKRMLAGSRTGVFAASYHNDYAQLQYGDPDAIDLRTLTGTLHSVLANRLSYFLDLRGPSISIDSACSSSLVAVHLACQSLRLGESNIAVAGGVSLMIVPELLVSMSKVGFMAPDGRCKTFDEAADGFGRGEGCSVVVLKRLSDAIVHADRVLAVIRGSAVNQDGHSTLLTAPNGPAQEALIREALTCAQLSPDRIGFVETHGTGTALGDPIEVEAIAAAIGQPFPGGGRCLLGSVKANIGHLEAAAGATGLIKAVLALRHEAVPGQVNYNSLNPHIRLSGTRLDVPTTLAPWLVGPVARCAAVSSFGVGGTNAHVVIEEAPRLPVMAVAGKSSAPPDGSWLLPLSARSAVALREQVQTWADFLAETSLSVADLCHTASQRRTHHEFRLAVVGRSLAELREQLQGHLDSGGAFRCVDCGGGSVDVRRRLRFRRTGSAMACHGPRAVRGGARLSRGDGRMRRPAASVVGLVAAGRTVRASGTIAAGPDRICPAGIIRDPGGAGRSVAILGGVAGRRRGPQRRRDRRVPPSRRAEPRGSGADRLASRPDHGSGDRTWPHGVDRTVRGRSPDARVAFRRAAQRRGGQRAEQRRAVGRAGRTGVGACDADGAWNQPSGPPGAIRLP